MVHENESTDQPNVPTFVLFYEISKKCDVHISQNCGQKQNEKRNSLRGSKKPLLKCQQQQRFR